MHLRFHKINFYCFIYDILKWNGISFGERYVRIQWLSTQFCAIALICAGLPALLPTNTFAPLVWMLTQWKKQITYKCYYKSGFVLTDSLKDQGPWDVHEAFFESHCSRIQA